MGVVYRAEDLKLGREIALKSLSKDLPRDATSLERFEREARAGAAITHPNICTVYEVGEFEFPAVSRYGVARRRDAEASHKREASSIEHTASLGRPDYGRTGHGPCARYCASGFEASEPV
jgi:hypothetical protein